jgi:hypothetical protein
MFRDHLIIADFIMGEKLATDPPNNDKDFNWQRNQEKKYKNKPRTPGRVTPPGTFNQSPSEIAHRLKQHSEDYGQASRKLNNYINKQGRNLQGEDRTRLYDAKETLKNAYGRPEDKTSADSSVKTVGIAEQPIHNVPFGVHNLDDKTWDLLKVVPDNREKWEEQDPQMATLTKALFRLRASVQNTEQDPSTRMSSVEEDAASTVTNNLDETTTPTLGDATFDSLDTKFEEVNPVSNSAYEKASKTLGQAMKYLNDPKWVQSQKDKK